MFLHDTVYNGAPRSPSHIPAVVHVQKRRVTTESTTSMSCPATEGVTSLGLSTTGAEISETPFTPSEAKTVCPFYLEGRCRFGENCHNVHPPGVELPKVTKAPDPVAKRSHEPEVSDGKKPPLKTAGDVRKRIQWDPELQKEHFSVGYLDRFSGVVEKPFTSFTWEHLSLVDLDQLAVPQHRIQYYKYKDVKVWDKNDRLDLVFGSAGGDTTIREVIQKVEEELAEKRRTCGSDDSDDDDDAVVIGVESESTSGKGFISLISEGQSLKDEPLRASHFFCIRVNDEEVRRRVALVQESVVQEDPTLRSCAMPGELLHITLAMVKLDSYQAIHEAGDLLEELRESLKAVFAAPPASGVAAPSRVVRAQGLSTFGARVLYSKLEVPESFNSAVDLLRDGLRKVDDAVITSHFDFVPHMTLIKVNRVTARERRSKYINSVLYSDYIDHYFGTIPIDNIHLCVIDDRRGPDGFYLTCQEVEI